jgi:hypothetical protein
MRCFHFFTKKMKTIHVHFFPCSYKNYCKRKGIHSYIKYNTHTKYTQHQKDLRCLNDMDCNEGLHMNIYSDVIHIQTTLQPISLRQPKSHCNCHRQFGNM